MFNRVSLTTVFNSSILNFANYICRTKTRRKFHKPTFQGLNLFVKNSTRFKVSIFVCKWVTEIFVIENVCTIREMEDKNFVSWMILSYLQKHGFRTDDKVQRQRLLQLTSQFDIYSHQIKFKLSAGKNPSCQKIIMSIVYTELFFISITFISRNRLKFVKIYV